MSTTTTSSTTTTTTSTTTSTISAPVTTTMCGNIIFGLDSVPVYDGTSRIDDFLSLIEQTAILANWTEQQMTAIAKIKLRQKAKQFLDSETELQLTHDWKTFKDKLKTQFTKTSIKGTAMKNFVECKQRSGESCREYLTRLKLLGNKTMLLTGNPQVNNTLKDKLEKDITVQFTLGLLMPLKQRVLSGNPQDLKEALEIAEREESIQDHIRPHNGHECRTVSYYNRQPGTSTDRRNGTQQNHQNIKCFNCNRPGHFKSNCPNRTQKHESKVCFICSKRGHIARNCPNPNTERKCFICKNPGHLARNCKTNPVPYRERTRAQVSLNSPAAPLQPRSQAVNEAGWE